MKEEVKEKKRFVMIIKELELKVNVIAVIVGGTVFYNFGWTVGTFSAYFRSEDTTEEQEQIPRDILLVNLITNIVKGNLNQSMVRSINKERKVII